jgi:hypothetical protein
LSAARRVRLPAWAGPLLLGVVCLFVYNANLRTVNAGDTLPARYLPLILWHDHTLGLTQNQRLVAHGHPETPIPQQAAVPGSPEYINYFSPHTYWMVPASGDRVASQYPVVTPLLVAPLYLPAYLYLRSHGWQQPKLDEVAAVMEKLTASLLAALASALLFLLLRRERIPWALPIAVAFAFGTDTYMISSQALWQHGAGELLVIVGLLLATARPTPRRIAALGFVCALMAANRPPDAFVALAFLAFVVWRDRRDLKWMAAGAALPILAVMAFNLGYVGRFLGGYAGKADAGKHFLRFDPLGPLGLLVSPGRGLLVFAPFLVFVPIGLAVRLRDPRTRQLTIALSVAVLAQILLYSQTDWRAGTSWGPRWLTDLVPIMVWMLAPAPAALRPAVRRVFAVTIVAAIAVQLIGAFWYTGVSDDRIFSGPAHSMEAAWKPANTPFLVELRHGPATADLRCGAGGHAERIGNKILTGDGSTSSLTQGAAIEGWALTCNRSPAQIIALVDGVVVGATTQFTPRPDVNRAFGTTAPPGWHLDANLNGVAPGAHTLQLVVRVAPRSDIRVLQELPVTVAPGAGAPAPGADLATLAARAAQRIRDDQSDSGYWLTTFTSGKAYSKPQRELNTYTPAVLADLLAPVAGADGLGSSVAKAQHFLANQIEPSGLVRYHGLPDAPTIGTLGCKITPDADDTALAWRVSGSNMKDSRVKSMLKTLARFRRSDGLYKTWLAAQSDYECIDPGTDPDPADLVNNMHIYLMLRRASPPAARRLCTAIQRAARADRAVVYYDQAPLVLYLRSVELGGSGCRVPLPTARLAHTAARGQEPWVAAVRALAGTLSARPDARARAEIDALLTRLGDQDFAALRANPPLMYHNDLTASVNRFYWSEDAGYALWLRLYTAARA